MVFSNISWSVPSIEPCIVMTSPGKLPMSPNLEGVLQTSCEPAIPIEPKLKDRAAVMLKVLVLSFILFLPRVETFQLYSNGVISRPNL